MKLTIEQSILMNTIEQRLHMQRDVVAAAELGAVMPDCGLCGEKLSSVGRVWQEGDNYFPNAGMYHKDGRILNEVETA